MQLIKINDNFGMLLDKEYTKMFFDSLHNEGYGFCLAEDIIKDNYKVTFESTWLGYGLGCGYLKFNYDNIHYELQYDEMIGLWLETKDVTEDSPEELKHKVFDFCKAVYLATVEKEKEKEYE